MNRAFFILYLSVILLGSCSSGKKALQKGDYFSAVLKAVERLKSSPENKKAIKVLKEGYQYALEWSQEEMDLALSSNSVHKFERVADLMSQVNLLSEEIRSTPSARKIISNPKSYTTELNSVYEKAAEERYSAGLTELDRRTRESARIAFDHFYAADRFVSGYKNVLELMDTAKEMATIKVVLAAIPVAVQKYRLTSEFFYNQISAYLNKQYGPSGFVNFYSAFQAESEGLENPDFIINMEFFDFSIGNLSHSEKEENLVKQVKAESPDTTKTEVKNYSAKLKIFTDKVQSSGSLRIQIYEPVIDKLLLDDIVPGTFTWINEHALYVGDIEALDKKQVELTKMKVLALPPEQDLFIEVTKPIYSQVTTRLNRFFQRYN